MQGLTGFTRDADELHFFNLINEGLHFTYYINKFAFKQNKRK